MPGDLAKLRKRVRARNANAIVRQLQSQRAARVEMAEGAGEEAPKQRSLVTLDDLWIQTKDGREICLGQSLNDAQNIFLADVFGENWRTENPGLDLSKPGVNRRALILKARQVGFTTLILGIFTLNACNRVNVRLLFLGDTDEKSTSAFEKVGFFYENLPADKKPLRKKSTKKELNLLANRSVFRVATAGSRDVGRSQTYQGVHGSEVAFWADAGRTAPGLFNSVPLDGAIILESTAEGDGTKDDAGNYLGGKGAFFAHEFRQAMAGQNGFHPVFLPWWAMQEYKLPVPAGFRPAREADETAGGNLAWTYAKYGDEEALAAKYSLSLEQLAFRRAKIDEPGMSRSKFAQEYPGDWEEALQAGASFMFPEFLEEQHVVRPFDIPRHCPGFGGFDWGFDKPAAFGIYRRLDDGSVVKTRELYVSGKTDRELSAEILSLIAAEGLEPGNFPIYADPSLWAEDRARAGDAIPPRRVDVYIAAGLWMLKAANGRLNGWANLREYLKQLKFKVFAGRCPATIRTIKNLPKHPYRQGDSDNRDTAGVEDHAADETRYALMHWPLLGREETAAEKFQREQAQLQAEAHNWRVKQGLEQKDMGDVVEEYSF